MKLIGICGSFHVIATLFTSLANDIVIYIFSINLQIFISSFVHQICSNLDFTNRQIWETEGFFFSLKRPYLHHRPREAPMRLLRHSMLRQIQIKSHAQAIWPPQDERLSHKGLKSPWIKILENRSCTTVGIYRVRHMPLNDFWRLPWGHGLIQIKILVIKNLLWFTPFKITRQIFGKVHHGLAMAFGLSKMNFNWFRIRCGRVMSDNIAYAKS